jgi:hypothetical protein
MVPVRVEGAKRIRCEEKEFILCPVFSGDVLGNGAEKIPLVRRRIGNVESKYQKKVPVETLEEELGTPTGLGLFE